MIKVPSNLEVPVFYPTYDEFKNFSAFIASIEARGAHKVGLAKIVPPKEWLARKSGYKHKEIDNKLVENPIKQEVRGRDGVYSVFNIQQPSIKLSSFQRLACSGRYAAPSEISNDLEKLEKKYWSSLTTNPAIYGADVSGSFYDENQSIWNVNHLGTILDDLVTEYGMKIQGVNTAYLYFGMWKASFAWHTEDMDLYSINYLHFGAPKQWYVIPPCYGKKFEKFAASRFPALARRCPAFLRHKMTVVTPKVLTQQSIPFSKMTQYEGEFIITFPYGYHAGFNYGFNCAESTNFALERWIEYGKHSVRCSCRNDMVTISMDVFVRKYQPELYNDWCRGINSTPHPEDIALLKTNKIEPITRKQNSNKTCIESVRTNEQHYHQKRISDERYACIFRNLAKFDKLKFLSPSQYPVPLIRAALCRAQFKMNKNLKKSSHRLLCLTANSVFNLPSLISASPSSLSITFNGLKQAGKYRENILNGVWNYQILNVKSEQLFNQWLSNQSSICSICYFFTANKSNTNDLHQSISSIRYLLKSEMCFNSSNNSNELLRCSSCCICVHRECYECLCLGVNADISDQYDPWLCQRCSLIQKNSNTIDDRCSACLLRGGLLVYSQSSSSLIHGLCSIYQAYSVPSQSNKCHYCWSFCPLVYRRISTYTFASCNHHKCTNKFHITCGLISGCTFQYDQDHLIIDARCHLHSIPSILTPSTSNTTSRSSTIDEMDEKTKEYTNNLMDITHYEDQDDKNGIVEESKRVPTGTRVLINDNDRQKLGQIIGNEISYHYSVDFGDDTYSHDMLAEDILHEDPSKLVIGSNVRTRWTDGTIYTCKYLGRQRVLLYHIKIDNEIRQLKRSEFSLDVEIPSPPLTPSANECDIDSNRQSLSKTATKRQNHQQPIKKKRRRLLISSSSSSDES